MVEYLLEAKKFIEYARAALALRRAIRILIWPSGALAAPSRKLGTSPRNKRQLSQRVKRPPSRTNSGTRFLTMSAYPKSGHAQSRLLCTADLPDRCWKLAL